MGYDGTTLKIPKDMFQRSLSLSKLNLRIDRTVNTEKPHCSRASNMSNSL